MTRPPPASRQDISRVRAEALFTPQQQERIKEWQKHTLPVPSAELFKDLAKAKAAFQSRTLETLLRGVIQK